MASHLAAQVQPPQARYSGHEFTLPVLAGGGGEPAPGGNFLEWMVDVKSPGDGFTCAAGTITVNRTAPAPTLFSNVAASPSGVLPSFNLGITAGVLNQRQVGIVQFIDAAQGLAQQRYFYGISGATGIDFTRATNVRGISVWPSGADLTTRVAICGETYDDRLPQSNQPDNPFASPNTSSGFIAVYNGLGDLLWTHHFYGGTAIGNCAVTDLSVRTELIGTPPVLTDVVTIVAFLLTVTKLPTAR